MKLVYMGDKRMQKNRIKELTEYIVELKKFKKNSMTDKLIEQANKELKEEMIKESLLLL